MKIKTIAVGIGAIIAVAFVVLFLQAPEAPQGAVSSPDIQAPYFSFGGVRHWGQQTNSLTTSTTTVCALQSPVSTSTLLMASVTFDVGTTTASTITLAKAATAYATTTVLATSTLAANARGTIYAATTTPVADTALGRLTLTNLIFAPSQYFVVSMTGGQGNFSPEGNCKATWMQN